MLRLEISSNRTFMELKLANKLRKLVAVVF